MEDPISPSPVLPRLDRLDRLLQHLEEKQSLSARHSSNPVVQKVKQDQDDPCKTLSAALEEVQRKGTLVERLTMLETRVLQLSLEMDEGNTSKSSSSTVPGSEKLDHGFTSSTGTGRKDDNEVTISQGTQSLVAVKDQNQDSEGIAFDAAKTGPKNGRRQSKKGYKKWVGWFHLGCN
ncbi:hypothetical protein ACH5RR_012002 [Cinchona calisaya]|uniref:Uncharacterized protein n=1 Tax=Cinchona calisaya TaxID=153742 RepID=A0ABD3A6I1_9GENT